MRVSIRYTTLALRSFQHEEGHSPLLDGQLGLSSNLHLTSVPHGPCISVSLHNVRQVEVNDNNTKRTILSIPACSRARVPGQHECFFCHTEHRPFTDSRLAPMCLLMLHYW